MKGGPPSGGGEHLAGAAEDGRHRLGDEREGPLVAAPHAVGANTLRTVHQGAATAPATVAGDDAADGQDRVLSGLRGHGSWSSGNGSDTDKDGVVASPIHPAWRTKLR